jgi:SAM-dependent methyltransferase
LRSHGALLTGDTSLQSATLESLATVKHYHAWLTDLALPYLGDHPLELGSGLGDYAKAWLDAGIPTLTLTELDTGRSARLENRFGSEPRIRIEKLDILDPPEGHYTSLVAFNVLEHIEDDMRTLSGLYDHLSPGGRLFLLVPAHPRLYGGYDRAAGHVRRYRKSVLERHLRARGFEIETLRHVNPVGAIGWFLRVRFSKGDEWPSTSFATFDRLVPALRWVDKIPVPFGLSLWAVARRPPSAV